MSRFKAFKQKMGLTLIAAGGLFSAVAATISETIDDLMPAIVSIMVLGMIMEIMQKR